MPTARESLLEAAHAAVAAQPWYAVRMVDVAAAAGVSRQTLYNEFGSKDGLGAALVDRLLGGFLDGAVRAAAEAARPSADPAACCAAAAAWMLRTARDEPIVHAALTGCWGARMPPPSVPPGAAGGNWPGGPGELTALLCRRMAVRLMPPEPADAASPAEPAPEPARAGAGEPAEVLTRACEAGLRIALSYVVAPPPAAPGRVVVRAGPGAAAAPGAARTGADEEACGRIGEVVRALLASR